METIPSLSTLPLAMSRSSAQMCIEASTKEELKVHRYWAYPLNAVVSLIGIALQPICTLINLIVAAIFKAIAWYTESFDLEARVNFIIGLKSLHAMFTLFVRIFYPAFTLDIVTNPDRMRYEDRVQRDLQYIRTRIPAFLEANKENVESYRKGEENFNRTFSILVSDFVSAMEREFGPERFKLFNEVRVYKDNGEDSTSGGAQLVVEEELFKAISLNYIPGLTEDQYRMIKSDLEIEKQKLQTENPNLWAWKLREKLRDLPTEILEKRKTFSPFSIWYHTREMAYQK